VSKPSYHSMHRDTIIPTLCAEKQGHTSYLKRPTPQNTSVTNLERRLYS